MKYALYQNQRITPTKDIKDAICPICGELVIPKCGEIKMHHWAHKTSQNCDPWWEKETEWHRKWKDHFPEDFQEYLMVDSVTGEKHIADIRTDKGFVIEFQHSSIKPEEKEAREAFYKNMVWVVDASKYYEKFKQALTLDFLQHCNISKNYFYIEENIYFNKKINFLPKIWLESSVPVVFDFGINDMTDSDSDKQKGWLYCIFPEKYEKGLCTNYCGIYLRKEEFINKIVNENKFYQNLVIDEFKLNEIKVEDEKMMQEVIHDIKNALEYNVLSPLEIFVTDSGVITDKNNLNVYNNSSCIILGVKSCKNTFVEDGEFKSEVLLLVKYKKKFSPVISLVPNGLLYDLFDAKINFQVRKLDVIDCYLQNDIFFKPCNEIVHINKETRNDLEYILNKFAGDIEKTT